MSFGTLRRPVTRKFLALNSINVCALLDVFRTTAAIDSYVSYEEVSDDRPLKRLEIKNSPSILDGFQIFIDRILRQSLPSRVNTNWKPRFRARSSGIAGDSTVSLTVANFSTVGSLVAGTFSSLPVLCNIYSGSRYLSHATLHGFCMSLLDTQYTCQRIYTSGGVTRDVYETYKNVSYKASGEFSFDFFGLVAPRVGYIGKSWRSYTVRLTFSDAKTITMDVTSIKSGSANSLGIPTGATTNHPAEHFTALYNYIGATSPVTMSVLKHPNWAMTRFTRGHYVTQSRAYTALVGDASRNFESLIESPELLGLYKALAAVELSSFVADTPIFLRRVAFFIKAIASGLLAYSFAIRPAIELLLDLVEKTAQDIRKLKGEAALTFIGDAASYQSLPETLRRLIDGALNSETVVRYSILFRSEVNSSTRAERLLDGLGSGFLAAAEAGFIPSPSQLWALQPATFIVDTRIPISTLMQLAEARLAMTTSSSLSFGHSASIRLYTSRGILYEIYMRSIPTTVFVDPIQGDIWISPGGLPDQVNLSLLAVSVL